MRVIGTSSKVFLRVSVVTHVECVLCSSCYLAEMC
jgi:hypothetical protein